MKSKMKAICFVTFLVLLLAVKEIEAAGECGKTPIRSAAASLSPCLGAAGNARSPVPPICCSKVGALIRAAPKCLCAVLLSPLAKQAGIKPAIAITIPKRCNIRRRPVGKKCGRYTLP
ncbi:Protease inhibitor/seed storage/lipid transfer protein family protein [Melia azedarach]|uniref:Protease inhibitor/seed storage/lipid transfer protein family protein n=1 Tax=Melia azedarach TaxID=155640 RepID=A0ACC1XFF7_MELAZ|nr:Protease inhibitor/seed storage/lipid transfer protein family protein [Melia azedarach]